MSSLTTSAVQRTRQRRVKRAHQLFLKELRRFQKGIRRQLRQNPFGSIQLAVDDARALQSAGEKKYVYGGLSLENFTVTSPESARNELLRMSFGEANDLHRLPLLLERFAIITQALNGRILATEAYIRLQKSYEELLSAWAFTSKSYYLRLYALLSRLELAHSYVQEDARKRFQLVLESNSLKEYFVAAVVCSDEESYDRLENELHGLLAKLKPVLAPTPVHGLIYEEVLEELEQLQVRRLLRGVHGDF